LSQNGVTDKVLERLGMSDSNKFNNPTTGSIVGASLYGENIQ